MRWLHEGGFSRRAVRTAPPPSLLRRGIFCILLQFFGCATAPPESINASAPPPPIHDPAESLSLQLAELEFQLRQKASELAAARQTIVELRDRLRATEEQLSRERAAANLLQRQLEEARTHSDQKQAEEMQALRRQIENLQRQISLIQTQRQLERKRFEEHIRSLQNPSSSTTQEPLPPPDARRR